MADVIIDKYTSLIRLKGEASVPSIPPSTEETPPAVNPPGINPSFNAGIGIRLNSLVIGGVKKRIQPNDVLDIPNNWQYNVQGNILYIEGVINNSGEINIV